MARKIKTPKAKVYQAANSKLSSPLLKLMKDLDNLYWFDSKRLFTTQKLFKTLYYSPQTTKATRAFMLWGALTGSPARPQSIIKSAVSAANFRKVPVPRKIPFYKVGLKIDKKGQPIAFEIKGLDTNTGKIEKMPETKEVTKALEEAKFDKLSGNVAAQIIEKKIPPQPGIWILGLGLDIKKVLLMMYYLINGLMRKIKTTKNQLFEYEAIDNEDALLKANDEELDEKIEGGYKTRINMDGFVKTMETALEDYNDWVMPALNYFSAYDEGVVFKHHYNYLIEYIKENINGQVFGSIEMREAMLNSLYDVCHKTLWPLFTLMHKIGSARFDTPEARSRVDSMTQAPEKFVFKSDVTGYKSFSTDAQIYKSFDTAVNKLFGWLDERWKKW